MSEPVPEEPEDEQKKGSGWDWADLSCDGCDTCGDGCSLCDGCNLLRLSTLLLVVAAAAPPPSVVLAGIAFYRRRLTRFTPRCPSEPSCSAYAVEAVGRLGARRGLMAAARRIRACVPDRVAPRARPVDRHHDRGGRFHPARFRARHAVTGRSGLGGSRRGPPAVRLRGGLARPRDVDDGAAAAAVADPDRPERHRRP